jgi:hypothetical protein
MSQATDRGGGEADVPSPTASPTEPDLSKDEIFEILSNRRRRYALHCLKQQNQGVALGEVSEQVAAWETDKTVRDVDTAERKRVYTSLQQCHLPQMDKKGVVNFEREEGVIELGEAAEDVDVYMEVTDEYDLPWSFYYLGLGCIGTVLVTLSWLGFEPFAAVPDTGWVAFVLTALLISASVHTALTRKMRLGRDGKPPEKRV